MAITSLSHQSVTVPVSSQGYDVLRKFWTSMDALTDLLESSRSTLGHGVHCILSSMDDDFNSTMLTLDARFCRAGDEAAKREECASMHRS